MNRTFDMESYRKKNVFDDVSDSFTSTMGSYVYKGGAYIIGSVVGIIKWGASKVVGGSSNNRQQEGLREHWNNDNYETV